LTKIKPKSAISIRIFNSLITFALNTKAGIEMYLLKIKGKAKIPDYIQLRDENFTLKAYFRVDRPEKSVLKLDLNEDQMQKLLQITAESPFGIVQKLEL
jgi:hypothetical protein